jgi:hypothetical protein
MPTSLERGNLFGASQIMQKSAHTNKMPIRTPLVRAELLADKGQKFEPFWNVPMSGDRRHWARVQRADQKR